jgi:catechol-2,3-dioxygenase
VLGAQIVNRVNFSVDDARRGRSIHTNLILGDFLFALMLPKDRMPMPPPDQLQGMNGFRHAFAVPRVHFDQMQDRLTSRGVPFEGPADHPERGPIGQSIYLKDPGGNFLEICWRRDEDRTYHPVALSLG